MRLNRYLALCGLGSRRKCEELILTGQVNVNDSIITGLATQVDESDRVTVDGRNVVPQKYIYFLLNKPAGYITTVREQFGRDKVIDLIGDVPVKPVGRLDTATTGVLLLTNDGELLFRLTHPKYEIARVYQGTVLGIVTEEFKNVVANGVDIGDGQIAHGRILEIRYQQAYSRITLELKEGMNREVRRIFEALGHKVISLDRVSFAGIQYSGLERGQFRALTITEVDRLKAQVGIIQH